MVKFYWIFVSTIRVFETFYHNYIFSSIKFKKSIKLLGYSISGKILAFLLLLITSLLILAQPNFSMFVILFLVFMFQYLTVGINFRFLFFMGTISILIAFLAYIKLSHVQYR